MTWPSVEENPLHSLPLTPGSFWACEHPERPLDPVFTCWDWRCYACFRHGEACLAHNPDAAATHSAENGRSWQSIPVPLSVSVADARQYHDPP